MLLLASGFWIGGAAAWAPIAGYLLAPHVRFGRRHVRFCNGDDARSGSGEASRHGGATHPLPRLGDGELQRRVCMLADGTPETVSRSAGCVSAGVRARTPARAAQHHRSRPSARGCVRRR